MRSGLHRKGSTYALVVGDKVYALDTSDKSALDTLDKLADQQAKVTGQANGDTIAVSSVAQPNRLASRSPEGIDFGTSEPFFLIFILCPRLPMLCFSEFSLVPREDTRIV